MRRFLLIVLLLGLSGAAGAAADAAAEAATDDPEPKVRLQTTLGNIDLVLFPDRAPLSVANFLQLVDDGFYDGLIFHRVIANFMIQAGGFDAQMNYREAPGTVANESSNGLKNRKFRLAMARLNDPDSAGAQFFINVRSNPHLDATSRKPGYSVFGEVIDGQDVVEQIELVETVNFTMEDGSRMAAVPKTPVVIIEATRLP